MEKRLISLRKAKNTILTLKVQYGQYIFLNHY